MALPPQPIEPQNASPDEALAAITRIAARRWRPAGAAWLLLASTAVVAFWSLMPGPSLSQHECYVAQAAREMLQTGDWTIPHFSGMPRLQKPPLAYWSVAALARLTGRLNDAVARLPSALAAVGLVALMGLFGWRAFGTASLAWISAAVMGFTAAWLFWSHIAIVEMQLTLWCTLTGVLFWLGVNSDDRARRIGLFTLMGGAFGLALLAKAPMPLAVLPPGFLAYLLVTRRGRRIGMYLLESLPGLAVAAILFVPWVLAVLGRLDIDAVGAKWYREFIDRFAGELGPEDRVTPWWYYGPPLLWMLLPWTLSLPEALAGPWLARYRPWRDPLLLALCIAIGNLVLLSAADYKQAHYLLPAIPWFCLLLAGPVWRFFAGPVHEHPRLFRRAGLGLLVAGIAGVAGFWLYASWTGPAYWRAAAIPVAVAGAGLALTGFALAVRARLEALYLLLLTITVTFCLGWIRLAWYIDNPRQEQEFAATVRRIVPDGAIVHSLGRPDSQLVYYGNLIMPRVLTDLETYRRVQQLGLPPTPDNMKLVTARAVIDLLAESRPIYVVTDFKYWQALQDVVEFTRLRPSLLHRHERYADNPQNDWVLFANGPAVDAAASPDALP